MEEWRDVVGYEGYYQVSSLGRIRSFDRRLKVGGNGTRFSKGRILKGGKDKDGYVLVVLCKDTVHKVAKVHRVVAEAFIKCDQDISTLEVNHIYENKSNNQVINLEWSTSSGNKQHSIKLREARGDLYFKSILTVEQVRQIRSRKKAGETFVALAKTFNVSKRTIEGVVYGLTYKWVK